jgi:hypothetical protein
LETLYDKARRIVSFYWRSGAWRFIPVTATALKNCSKAGMDPLEILRSYHLMKDKQREGNLTNG